jgi:hypothetical protein
VFFLLGCTTLPPISDEDYLPAASIINGLKCEFAKYVAEHKKTPFAKGGWKVAGELELQIVDDVGLKGGIEGDSILALQPASIDFGFGGGMTKKRTRRANVEFVLTPNVKDKACLVDQATKEFYLIYRREPSKRLVVQGIGLERWLASFDQVAPHGPSYQANQYIYALTFAVTSEASANFGAKLAVIPIALSTSTYSKREDVQVLTMTIKPKSDPPGPTEIKIVNFPDSKPGFAPESLPPGSGGIRRTPPAISETTRRERNTARDRLFTGP